MIFFRDAHQICNSKVLIRYLLVVMLIIFACNSIAKTLTSNQLQVLLNESIKKSITPGAVLLISNPQIGTITFAAGLADKENKIPMKITNNFRIASMSKTFLAVLILKLIEDGELALNDKIVDLLPDTLEIDRIPNGHSVTVQQLLQMRSGIPNYIDYESYTELIDKMINKKWTPEVCIQLIYDKKPTFAPGTDYEYSNTNYLLLQMILEHLLEESYADAMRSKLLDPLQLKHTFVETQETDKDHYLVTKGYSLDDGQLIDVTDYNDGWGMGDGGMISTAADLNLFINALLKDKTILNPDSLHTLLSFKDDYGLGIWREEINEEWAWSHNGLTSGFQGQYYYFPDFQLTIILLTNNFDTDIIEDVIEKTYQLIRTKILYLKASSRQKQ